MKKALFILILATAGCKQKVEKVIQVVQPDPPKPTHALKVNLTYDLVRENYSIQLWEWENGDIVATGFFYPVESKKEADKIIAKQLKRCNCPRIN